MLPSSSGIANSSRFHMFTLKIVEKLTLGQVLWTITRPSHVSGDERIVRMKSLMTIGYEGSTIDDFLKTLELAGVQVLVDVRAVTVSRKKGFSKNRLAARLEQHGIRYLHTRDLGDPKPGREAARAGDFATFRKIFGEHLATEAAQQAVRKVAAIARKEMACLMCYERDPSTCHRQIVATQLRDYDLISFDLFVDKKDKYERNPEKLPSHNPCKSTAAAEHRAL